MKVTKLHIWIIAIVLIVIIVFSIYFYRRGKKQVTIQSLPQDLPGAPSGYNNPAGASNTEIKMLAERIHDDLKGLNVWGHDNDLYLRMLALSDTDFVNLYNTFNTLYQVDSGQTLYEWIDNDFFLGWPSSESTIIDGLMPRFTKLNLK